MSSESTDTISRRILNVHAIDSALYGLREVEDLTNEISAIHRMVLQSRSTSKTGGTTATTRDDTGQQQSIDWGGYSVVVNSSQQEIFGPLQYETIPARGAGGGHRNLMIGGVLIGSDRAQTTSVDCSGKYYHLIQECNIQKQPESSATQNSDSSGHGRNPVFINNSPLFDRKVAARVSEFYNTTIGSPHMAGPHGIPHGFIYEKHEAELLGIHNFVYFDIALTERDATRLMRYLYDGRYMDRFTRASSLSIVTYNPNERTVGITTANCAWGTQVGCEFEVKTIPDTTWVPQSHMGLKNCISGLLLFILVSIYCALHFRSWCLSCIGSSGASQAMKWDRGMHDATIIMIYKQNVRQ